MFWIVIAILFGGVFVSARIFSAKAQAGQAAWNPSFEGKYVEWSQRTNLAPGWRLVHWKNEPLIDGGASGRSAQPECKPILERDFPYRVRSGDAAQCCFWFYTHGDAALYTRKDVEAGDWVFSAFAHTWTGSDDGNPFEAGEMYVSLGIDPEGRDPGQGGWPWETSVLWSPYERLTSSYKEYESVVVRAEQEGPITLYVRFWTKWDEKHSDFYVDDANLTRVGGSTEPLPTYTPYPTYTPLAPLPTYTPYPTPGPCETAEPGEFEWGLFNGPTFDDWYWVRAPNGAWCLGSGEKFSCVK